ncbi:UXT3, partial [Symbiodinium microadriaticum]
MGRSINWQDAVSGSAAGAVSKTATAPLERVKMVLQNQQLSVGRAARTPLRNVVHAAAQLLQEPCGLRGFWRGNLANVLRVVPTYGARFWLFALCDETLAFVPQTDTRRFISGGMAGVGALLLTHPLDCFLSAWRKGGVRGLYAGCFASMLEIAPYSAIVFTSYEGIKQRLMPAGSTGVLPSGPQILAGACSGMIAASICYPLDTIRRQLMLDGALGFDARYGGSIWKSGGFRSRLPTVQANSVGFYQITKLLIIPTVMGLERLQGRKSAVYSRKVILSIVVTAIGVAVATVSDFEMNVRGTILAALSIVSTAQYQIWQGSKQHEHGVTATQITYSVAWPQSIAGLASSLTADVLMPQLKVLILMRPSCLLEHQLSGQGDLFWIALCNVLAVCTNISVYGLIGKTSPVTYQVVGQLKTVLVVVFGYIFFDVRVPLHWLMLRFAGVGVAVVGVFSY